MQPIKQTKYDVPLFLSSVRTNWGIVQQQSSIQSESAQNIAEALLSPSAVKPFMEPSLLSEAEISCFSRSQGLPMWLSPGASLDPGPPAWTINWRSRKTPPTIPSEQLPLGANKTAEKKLHQIQHPVVQSWLTAAVGPLSEIPRIQRLATQSHVKLTFQVWQFVLGGIVYYYAI